MQYAVVADIVGFGLDDRAGLKIGDLGAGARDGSAADIGHSPSNAAFGQLRLQRG